MRINHGKRSFVQKLPSQIHNNEEYIIYKKKAIEDANWKDHPDVDYTDLDHFIENCRRLKNKDSFDTAIRILEAIKRQVTGKK